MKRYGTTLICLFLCFCLSAQEFKPMDYNGTLYQEFVSNVADKEDAALVIYLHGKHSSGNDNRKQISNSSVRNISNYLKKNHISAYFLVPQCPEDHEWDEGRCGIPGYTDRVEDLITLYMKTKYIDVSKIYICGTSMGAMGVWRILKDNPKLFAAAIIASGQALHASPSDFIGIPLYVTVGSEERSYEALKWFTSEIQGAGGTVLFDVLWGLRHHEATDSALSPQRLEWLFSQKKGLK